MKLITQRILFLICSLYFVSCKQSQEIPLSERYPAPWQTNFNLDISKVISKKNITNCGEFKYRESVYNSGEYLVYCSSDGNNWTSYIVWPNTGDIIGPNTADMSLQ